MIQTIAMLRRFISSNSMLYLSFVVSIFIGLGSVPLFDLDEGAFTEATREMLDSGVYSATYLDGEPRYDKPIFFYWLQAASIKTLGFNEWAFRMPSALMACLWALALLSFARQFIGRQRGLIASLFLVNSLLVALIARSAIADATLNLFLSLALFDIWRYFDGGKNKHIWRVYFWMGLATLTKGPVGVVVPLLVSCLFLLTSRANKKQFLAYVNLPGWGIYIASVAPWLVAVYLEQGMGFFQGFIVEHNLQRFSATRESHGGTIFYYALTLPLIVLPLSGMLVHTLANVKSLWQHPLNRFLILWFLVYFVIFSFSKTQLPHYILNGCTPLFILFAQQKNLFSRRPWLLIAPLLLMLLLVFLPQLVAIAAQKTGAYDGANLARHAEAFTSSYTLVSVLCLLAIAVISFLPQIRTWQRLVVSGLIINGFVFTQLVAVVWELQQRPVHEAIAALEKRKSELGLEEVVVAWRMHMPTFSVYRQKITPLRAPQPGEIALARVDRVDRLVKQLSEQWPEHESNKFWQFGGLVMLKLENREQATHEVDQ